MGNKFGEYLKKLREERKLTLREVEAKVQISNAYLSQVERGERNIPTFKVLKKLAEAYGVSIDELSKRASQDMSKQKMDTSVAAPELEYLCRGYENLTEDGKKELSNFLQYLQQHKGKK
jgi:transcriptional regulator with XRE-family HTH domain